MSERTLDVLMDGEFVGRLCMNNGGALSFAYDEVYASQPDSTPLSLSMPLHRRRHSNRVVLPFLQGLLPDNPLALESMANACQVSPNSPFALLEHVGHDVAGALQIIHPGEESEDAAADRKSMTVIDDERLTVMLRDVIAVYDDGVLMRTAQRMSLAGAQAKLGVAKTVDGLWAVPSRGVPTTHIFKPRLVDTAVFPESDIVEMFCQSVVADAGLNAAHTSMWHSPDGAVHAIVSERYDRQLRDDGTYRRLHQEDLCQAMSVSPAKKYQRQDGGPGVGQIGTLLSTHLAPSLAADVARRFLEALTANVVLLNTDAHAKNYSLMLSGSSVNLAPLYDVLSIGAFLEPAAHPLFPMKLGGTFDLEQVFPETMVKEARRLGIAADAAESAVCDAAAKVNASLDVVAERMAGDGYDRHGIITRTVESVRRHSALARALSA